MMVVVFQSVLYFPISLPYITPYTGDIYALISRKQIHRRMHTLRYIFVHYVVNMKACIHTTQENWLWPLSV